MNRIGYYLGIGVFALAFVAAGCDGDVAQEDGEHHEEGHEHVGDGDDHHGDHGHNGDHDHGDHGHDHGDHGHNGDHDHGHDDGHDHGDHGHDDDHDHGDHGHGDDHDHGDHGHDHGGHGHDDEHDHGDHGDHDHDDHDHDDHDHHGEIHFPGEYQDKIDFEIEEAAIRRLRPSIPVQAQVTATSSGQARSTAPFEGTVTAPEGGISEVGEAVDEGEVLAYVTPRVDPEQLAQIGSDLETAQARLNRAQREVERIEPLVESGALAERHLEDAQTEREVAQAELERATQRNRQVEDVTRGGARGRVAVRSPIDGVVSRRSVVRGEFVTTGTNLLEVIDDETLWLEMRMSEANLSGLGEPQGAWFSVGDGDSIDLRIGDNSRLVSFGQTTDPQTRMTTLILEMDEPAPFLRPGSSFRAHVYGQESREVLTISRTALLEQEGTDVAFVSTGAESFERRVVEVGAREGAYVEIRSGLEAGEPVVSRGNYQVHLAASVTGDVGHGHAH